MKRSYHNLTIYTRPLVNGDLSLWVRHKFGSGKYSYSKTDIVVHTRKEDSNEENWKDNFEVSSIHKIPR